MCFKVENQPHLPFANYLHHIYGEDRNSYVTASAQERSRISVILSNLFDGRQTPVPPDKYLILAALAGVVQSLLDNMKYQYCGFKHRGMM